MAGMRVRIGPSVDRRAFDQAFAQMSTGAKRAFDKVVADAKKSGEEEVRAAKKTATQIEREKERQFRALQRETERWRKQELRDVERAERMKLQAQKRADHERIAQEKRVQAEMERSRQQAIRNSERMYRQMRQQAQQAARARAQYEKAHPRWGVSLGHGTSLTMGGVWGAGAAAVRMGLGVAGDIVRAYGVNTSLGSAMSANADMETLAAQITNEAHERGKSYYSPDELKEQAFNIGSRTGTGANQIMRSFQEYVGRTGDLTTATQTMEQLAKISKALGANLQDVTAAAAAVGNQLGNIPDKGRKVNEVMMMLAGESKLGAVSIRQLASQAPKIVASAQMFEGDISGNMATLGALAQETGLRGGVGSAAQAATAVQSLATVFRTPTALRAFKAKGININGAGGKIRNLEDIVVESLQKTQRGTRAESNAELNKLFMGQRSGRAIAGFENLFRSTYASATGTEQERLAAATKATREEFTRLQNAAMDQKEVDESFARAMQTGQSKAEQWNNATQKAAGEMQKALLPALVALTPKVVAATEGFSGLIDWITGQKKGPQGATLATDMDAVHKALKAPGGHVDQALVNKSIKDAQKLGEQATNAENEARGLKEHRNLNVLAHGAMAGWETIKAHPWMAMSGVGLLGGVGSAAKSVWSGEAGKAADTEQKKAADEAKKAGDAATAAFRELTSKTLQVHIVSSDVPMGGEGGGASQHATDQLSTRPSGH